MTKNNTNELNKELALEFLVCCYFGKSEKLLGAAIDRAYVDMASHTLEGFKDTNKKWDCRFNASNCIYNAIKNYPSSSTSYDDWHLNTIKTIKKCYSTPALEEGQAQKWLNMTVKYLYVFKCILGIDYPGLADAKSFLSNTNEKDYWPPVDSYILKGSGHPNYMPWSGITNDKYKDLKISMDAENQDFIWELKNWETYREKYEDSPTEGSYKKHLKKNKLEYGKGNS